MIGLPFYEGALQLITISVAEFALVGGKGLDGGIAWKISIESDGNEYPRLFLASTVKSYVVPSVKPSNVSNKSVTPVATTV